MEVVHPRCAGLDVSKRDVKVCVRVQAVDLDLPGPRLPSGGRLPARSWRCGTCWSQKASAWW
jgi:hypothetical protein